MQISGRKVGDTLPERMGQIQPYPVCKSAFGGDQGGSGVARPHRNLIFGPRLGDMVEAMAKPIAKALNMKCLDEKGGLKPESSCAKRRDALNKMIFPT